LSKKSKRPLTMISAEVASAKSLDDKRFFPAAMGYLFLTDTAPCHPSCELLDHENGFLKLTFLPSNTSNCYSKFKKAI
ncbi:hypothetical protein T02_16505, partial [Trichinella nativa]